MPLFVLFTYAYLLGFAASACAATLAELGAKSPAGMRAPFVTADHILRSLGLVAVAGPYLLFRELKSARQEAGLPLAFALAGLVFANGWALALGIVLVEAMSSLTRAF
jgi:hypothetical protein